MIVCCQSLSAQTLVPGMHAMSIVPGVKFTWIIVSSDNEISMNLRFNGTESPPVTLVATALTKDGTTIIGGSQVLNTGWTSPNSVVLKVNGSYSLYDADMITVYATPFGTSVLPPLSQNASPSLQEPAATEAPYQPNSQSGNDSNCHPSYIGVCIPPPLAQINCSDIQEKDFTVRGPDPHDLDRDGNGIGCESSTIT